MFKRILATALSAVFLANPSLAFASRSSSFQSKPLFLFAEQAMAAEPILSPGMLMLRSTLGIRSQTTASLTSLLQEGAYTAAAGVLGEYLIPMAVPGKNQSYRIDQFEISEGKLLFVVHVDGEARLAIRDTGDEYESYPLHNVSTEIQIQRHLEVLYNFLSLYREHHPSHQDIQVRDSFTQNSGRAFMDRLSIYYELAHRRNTMSPLLPRYRKPVLPKALKVALRVNPKANNFESVILSQLLGNPDVDVSLIVGTTPLQLFLTMHSSVHRYFLPRDVFDYDDEAGVIKIYGHTIRVIRSWGDLSPEELSAFQIRSVVSTDNASAEADRGASSLLTHSSEAQHSIHRVSLQDNLVSPVSALYHEGGSAAGVFERTRNGVVQLANSRVRLPIVFVNSLLERVPALRREVTVGLHLSTPQRNETPILDKTSQVGGAGNVIWGDGGRLQQMQQGILGKWLRSQDLEKPTLQYDPTQVGTRADISIYTSLSKMLTALGLSTSEAGEDRKDLESRLTTFIVDRLFRNDQKLDGLILNVMEYDKVAPSYARGNETVLLSQKQIQVSVTGEGRKRKVKVVFPLMFDDQIQDIKHLENVLQKIGQEENRNLTREERISDLHHSSWQQQQDIAFERHTLPPREPDLPPYIQLRDHPRHLGVIGLGRTGGLFVRNLFRSLNLSLVAIAGVRPDEIQQALLIDTAQGTWTSNGVDVNVSQRVYQTPKGQKIGSVKFNDDKSVAVLSRADNPSQIDWAQAGVEMVFEATGGFSDPNLPDSLLGHLSQARGNETGADTVLLSAPFKLSSGVQTQHPVIISGLNNNVLSDYVSKQYANKNPLVLSGASCTTTCGAFLLKANAHLLAAENVARLLNSIGINNPSLTIKIISAFGVTIHALTNTQLLHDSIKSTSRKEHSRMRAARGILPTETGLSKALKPLGVPMISAIAEVIDATSDRVPTETGSHLLATFTWELSGLSPEEINKILEKETKKQLEELFRKRQHEIYDEFAWSPELRGIVEHRQADEATGSNQIVGSRAAALYDSQETTVKLNKTAGGVSVTMRVAAWYDNENGFSARQVGTMDLLSRLTPASMDKGHAFYIPSFFELFQSVRRLFPSVHGFLLLTVPLSAVGYLLVLPRFAVLNAYGPGQWRMKAAMAWKALNRGLLLGYHEADGASIFAEGFDLTSQAFRYLERHEFQSTERAGLFSKAVVLNSNPIYVLAAIISSLSVWLIDRQLLSADLKGSARLGWMARSLFRHA